VRSVRGTRVCFDKSGPRAAARAAEAGPAMTSRSVMKVIPFRRKILYEQRSREQTAVNNTEETRELA
jgi:hypothetical protein